MPPVRGTVRSTAALIAVASVTACGGGRSDEEQVRDTLVAFGRATARQDYKALCERILAPRLVRSVREAGLPCEQAMRRGGQWWRRGLGGVRCPQISVGPVRVDGETAPADVRTSAAGQEPSRDTV